MRDFLDQEDATFDTASIEEVEGFTYVQLGRQVPGDDGSNRFTDSFVVEVDGQSVFFATLHGNAAIAQPSGPNGIDEARATSEAFFAVHDRFSGQLAVIDESSNVYISIDEQRYDRVWQFQVDGVWLPTTVKVSVSLETGLVVGYMLRDFPYDGPLTPMISEREALRVANEIIREDPGFAGSTIVETRLEVLYSGGDDTIVGQIAGDPIMDWRLAWVFTLENRPAPDTDHFMLVDALTGFKLEAGG